MKKAEAKLLGWVVVLAIIIYPFVWLQERIGWWGMGLIAAVVLGLIVFSGIRSGKQKQKDFDNLALNTLHHHLHHEDEKRINLELAKADFPKSALIRNLQILRDSVEIALTSKNRGTAESRMNTVLECYDDIRANHSGLVSKEVLDEINRVVLDTKNEFHTKLFLNIAQGHLEKVEKLKTAKAKKKHIDLAIEALKEGIEDGLAEEALLKRALARAEESKASLG